MTYINMKHCLVNCHPPVGAYQWRLVCEQEIDEHRCKSLKYVLKVLILYFPTPVGH